MRPSQKGRLRPARLLLTGIFSASLLAPFNARAQQPLDPVSQAMAQGDLYQSKRKYDLALEAFHKADKLSHHTSAEAYLKIASVERKLGDLSAALDDAKRAVKVAAENKSVAVQAHLFRATLLAQMSGKRTDKKLREAEDDLRQALALDSAQLDARFDLGIVLLKQERDSEGIAELKALLSTPGADPSLLTEARRVVANPIRAREPFAPDFEFTTRENQSISNSSLRGKVVLLDFWGTWCPPCRESVPMLRDLHKKYASKPFQLVGISSDDDEDVWRTFVEAQRMNWSEYIDLSGTILEAFKVDSFPTYVVLDKDGVIRFRQSGLSTSTQLDLEDAINKALKRASDPALAVAASASEPPTPSSGETGSENRTSDASPFTPLSDIEAGNVLENIYKNEALGLSYEFPRGWIVAQRESIHAANERTEAAAKAAMLQQHPELAGTTRFAIPKVIFYASQRGDGDGQRLAIPSVRISAAPSRLGSLSLDVFRQMSEQMVVASGAKVLSPASEFLVKDHQFLRADFERRSGASTVCQSYIQTLAADYLLTIELFASSPGELQKLAVSLQSMSISDDDR